MDRLCPPPHPLPSCPLLTVTSLCMPTFPCSYSARLCCAADYSTDAGAVCRRRAASQWCALPQLHCDRVMQKVCHVSGHAGLHPLDHRDAQAGTPAARATATPPTSATCWCCRASPPAGFTVCSPCTPVGPLASAPHHVSADCIWPAENTPFQEPRRQHHRPDNMCAFGPEAGSPRPGITL